MTGCVDHHGKGGGPVIANIDITQKPDGVVFGPGWKTYAERLQDAGISWRVYRQGTDLASDDDSDGGMNTLMAFERFHTAKPGDPLYHAGAEPRRLEAPEGRRPEQSPAAGVVDHAAAHLLRTPQLAARLRRGISGPHPGRPDLQPGGLEQDCLPGHV